MEEGEDPVSVSWDLNSIKEEEFEKYVVYIVPDLPAKSDCANRAESTLPRNLVLKPSQALSDVSTVPALCPSQLQIHPGPSILAHAPLITLSNLF